jgi:acetoin utilization deacetylase AcuC-like enzyme
MKFVYSERYRFNVGVHVFPTEKYKMVRDGLLAEGLARTEDFVEPPEPSVDDIRLVHTKEYVDDLLNLRWTSRTVRSELPLTWEIVQGFFLHASGTILACQLALNDGVAMNIGGGFHHAFPEHGEGFCYINDIAVAIKKLQKEGKLERAAVIDCDLHQGNGTARIFQNEPRVYTFSIHQEHLYPIKERSDWDIGLEDETGDEEYNRLMKEAVPRIISEHRPQLIVYVAGADPYFNDQLGTLKLTKRGLALRDRIVLENCRNAGIPVATVLAGGYALDTKDTAEIHINTAKECLRVLGQLPPKSAEENSPHPNESETTSA